MFIVTELQQDELVAVPIMAMVCPFPVVVSTVEGNETKKDDCAFAQKPDKPINIIRIIFFIRTIF